MDDWDDLKKAPSCCLAPLIFVIRSRHDTDLWAITASSQRLYIYDRYQYAALGIQTSIHCEMLSPRCFKLSSWLGWACHQVAQDHLSKTLRTEIQRSREYLRFSQTSAHKAVDSLKMTPRYSNTAVCLGEYNTFMPHRLPFNTYFRKGPCSAQLTEV